jgi:transcriptional regulator with XRE-family HTH domain
LRESRGISAGQAAEAIRGSHSKISRMEHGRVGFKERDVADLLTLYGVTDTEERAALLNLAREANTPGWWHAYSDILTSWLEPYVGLEAAASVIRTYQVQFVPGLLQAEGYARALIRQGSAATEEEIARRGELRASRQEILRRPDAPQLWAVVDEGALRRPVGEPGVMYRQLHHLLGAAEQPHVTLRVVPLAAGAHAGLRGPFVILEFAEEPALAYLENHGTELFLEEEADLAAYRLALGNILHAALAPAATVELITQIAAELS